MDKTFVPIRTDVVLQNETAQLYRSYQDFLQFEHLYSSAVREIQTRLEVLNEEFSVRYDHNPIHHVESRLKSTSSIIEKLRSTRAVAAMMYTSDHGENIFDDSRRLFLHAAPRPSEYDTDVPLLVWTSEAYAREYAPVVDAMKSNLNKGVQTSASVFPTMLSIGGISTKARVDSLSLTNPRYRMGTRLYLNDHNHAVPLKMYGIE